MRDFFETRVTIEDAQYDEENQVIMIFVTVDMTGEKKILLESKAAFRYGEGASSDFPDRLMYQRVQLWKNLRNKSRNWRLYTDNETKKMTADVVQNLSNRVGVQMDELKDVVGSDERILERKKEDLVAQEEKSKAQQKVIEKLKQKVQSSQLPPPEERGLLDSQGKEHEGR